jgi:hypothetical protein
MGKLRDMPIGLYFTKSTKCYPVEKVDIKFNSDSFIGYFMLRKDDKKWECWRDNDTDEIIWVRYGKSRKFLLKFDTFEQFSKYFKLEDK